MATVMRNRLAAVLLVGIGPATAGGAIFAFHGAPDLALTQFLVETLTLGSSCWCCGCRRPRPTRRTCAGTGCPARCCRWRWAPPSPAWRRSRWPPASTAPSPNCRPMPPITAVTAPTPSTCILVDIRAWDTLGEDLGPGGRPPPGGLLVFRHRRFGSAPWFPAGRGNRGSARRTALQPGGRRHHPAARQRLRDLRYRSLVLEVATGHHLPAHHGAIGLLLLHRAQHPGRRFRGRADRGLALVLRYRRRPLRTRRDAAAGRRQILGAGLALSAATAMGFPCCSGAGVVVGGDLAASCRCSGHVKDRDGAVLRPGVYLIVVGLVLDATTQPGARIDEEMVALRRREHRPFPPTWRP